MILTKIQNILNDLSNIKSKEEKIKYLQKYILDYQVLNFFIYCYSPYKNYKVTKNSLLKHSDLNELEFFKDIFSLCDYLENSVLPLNNLIAITNGFISQNIQYKDLILNFFNHDLKIKLSIDELNIIFHNQIPVFNPAIPDLYVNNIENFNNQSNKYCIQRLLKGTRVITYIQHVNNDISIRFFTLSNKEIFSLDVLKQELLEIYTNSLYKDVDIVLDGNICLIENKILKENDIIEFENWNITEKILLQKNNKINYPRYFCYDLLLLQEFQGLRKSMNYDIRYKNLKQFICGLNKKWKNIAYIFAAIYNEVNYKILKKEYINSKKWNGFIYRKLVPYKVGKTKDILKLEFF